MTLTNWLLKSIIHAKTYVFFLSFFFEIFFVWKYDVIFLFERLGRMHENKIYIF